LVKSGELGIKFLARVYSPNIWFGDLNSVCDLPRQLSKFHVTVVLPDNVTATTKLLEKVRSYLLTDAKTPILGEYCTRVSHVYGKPLVEEACTMPMRHWLSQVDIKDQYPNDPGSWVDHYVHTSLPHFDVKSFREWVNRSTTIEQLLAPPMFSLVPEAESKVPVVVDENILPAGQPLVPEAPRDNKKIKKQGKERRQKETAAECERRKRVEGSWVERKVLLPAEASVPHEHKPVTPPPPRVELPTQRLEPRPVMVPFIRVSEGDPPENAPELARPRKPPKKWVAVRH
jgi:hypothetical protein